MPPTLTPSQENYLEHILHLSDDGTVRIREIAEAAGVRRPSVTRAVAKLAEYGLVRHDAYGKVEITDAGILAAEAVRRRDDCLTSLLIDVLAMDPDAAKGEVCRLEHVLGLEVLARLEVLVGHATESASASWLKTLRRKLTSKARANSGTDTQVGTASLHAGRPSE